ncbi:neuronal acetylcholine receptor subunit alpha-3-like [Babylonia areolata]|uniref:neuronal acetylcholine receptor subunit alpha-3-like n=1 Tax=Babylonia areolata TaxID=304850 RepID=UPI003FD48A05
MLNSALTALSLVLITDMCLSQSALNVSKLHDELLNLIPNVRPVNDVTQPTVVNISFHLLSIISLDTVSQKLVSNGWMSVVWHNDYVSWNPEHHGGVWRISPHPDRLWRPRLTVLNTLKDLKPVGEDYVVIYLTYKGEVFWLPAERFETFCRVDVTFFPFDIQRCRWEFFGWAQDVNEIVLQLVQPSVCLDSFQKNGEWSVMDTTAWVETRAFYGFPFSVVNYEVTLRRRPTLLALTVLLPVVVQSVVNMFVFTIPSEAGERLAYAMTSFLSFGVFMSFIVDLMPSSTETLSIMAVSLSCQLILSAVYVLFCILSLRLFHRDPHKHPVPPTLQTLIVGLELLLCLDPPSQPRNAVHTEVETISSDNSGTLYGTGVKGSRLQGHLARWARKRKVRQEAYTQPQDMTWQRVSRSLDKLLFRIFFCLVMMYTVVVIIIMTSHYFNAV